MTFVDPFGLAERKPGETIQDGDTCTGKIVDGWCTGYAPHRRGAGSGSEGAILVEPLLMAKPPITVVDGEDVAFYADVESVIRAIEAVDLTDAELRIYDGNAAVLKPQTEVLKRKMLNMFNDDVTSVVGLLSDGSYDVEALTASLRRFVQYLRGHEDKDNLAGEGLSALLREAITKAGYSR